MGASTSSTSSRSFKTGSYSGNKKTSTGERWLYQIYFDPEADKVSGEIHYIKDSELLAKLSGLLDYGEDIKKVTAYKVPINDWQLTTYLIYHLFIVFETENWWWSIEKHVDGITIQRSKIFSAVRDKYRQKDRRLPIKQVKTDRGRCSVKKLIEWLYIEDELHKEFHTLFSNCKTFAKGVYDHVAETTLLFWFDGAFS